MALDTGTNVGNIAVVSRNTTGRHSDNSNWLMCDGHVKWLRGSAVSPGTNADKPTDQQGKSASGGGLGGGGFNACGTAALSSGSFSATLSAN